MADIGYLDITDTYISFVADIYDRYWLSEQHRYIYICLVHLLYISESRYQKQISIGILLPFSMSVLTAIPY